MLMLAFSLKYSLEELLAWLQTCSLVTVITKNLKFYHQPFQTVFFVK